jgi:hypothetical protein
MKFAADRPYSDPEKAARKLIEIANSVEAVQDGRIYIELINAPFLYKAKGNPAMIMLAVNAGVPLVCLVAVVALIFRQMILV